MGVRARRPRASSDPGFIPHELRRSTCNRQPGAARPCSSARSSPALRQSVRCGIFGLGTRGPNLAKELCTPAIDQDAAHVQVH